MKKHTLLVLAALTFVLSQFVWSQADVSKDKQATEDPDFVHARQLFWSGKYAEAEEKFSVYLLGHPNHQPTKSFLQMIAQAKKHDPKSKKFDPSNIDFTRKRLEEIKVAKIEFNGTPWKSVAENLQELANPNFKKEDKEANKNRAVGEHINFIHMLPENFSGKVTLSLQDISLLRVIDYATRQAGLTYVIDKSAIIFEVKEAQK
jgi:hypothetical protein